MKYCVIKTRKTNKTKKKYNTKKKNKTRKKYNEIYKFEKLWKFSNYYDISIKEKDNYLRNQILYNMSPFHLLDKYNGYTNYGYYNCWNLKNIPKNCYYIEPTSGKHIADILKSWKHNIIVKNTGHDYIGRSFPKKENTLVIFTHNLNKINWCGKTGKKCFLKKCHEKNNHYVSNTSYNLKYGYVEIQAGVQWLQLFNGIEDNNLCTWALKGGSNTVGAAGGWLCDGGFGLFSKTNGMGVNNLLYLKVILPNGKRVKISAKQYKDLWFAFRGGGAGNFGIIETACYKLLPPLKKYGELFGNIQCKNKIKFIKVFSELIETGVFTHKLFGGQLQMKADFSIEFYFSFMNMNTLEVSKMFKNFTDRFKFVINIDNDITTSTTFPKPNTLSLNIKPISTIVESEKIYTLSRTRWSSYQSYNDYIVGFGSKYLLIDDINNPKKCAEKIIKVFECGANQIQLEISKGLYGLNNTMADDIRNCAIHPEVLQAVGLIYIRSYLKNFNPNIIQPLEELEKVVFKYESHDIIFPNYEEKKTLFKKKSQKEAAKLLYNYLKTGVKKSSKRIKAATICLRNILIGNSTYINHSACKVPNYYNEFWGEQNYKKLKEIKKKYDPLNKFNNIYGIDVKT